MKNLLCSICQISPMEATKKGRATIYRNCSPCRKQQDAEKAKLYRHAHMQNNVSALMADVAENLYGSRWFKELPC